MIPATQREALDVLAEVCELSPDIRLGQMFAHLGFLGEDQTGRVLADIDDEQLLAVLYTHRAELVARANQDDVVTAVREGLADVKSGRTRPAHAMLQSLKRKQAARAKKTNRR